MSKEEKQAAAAEKERRRKEIQQIIANEKADEISEIMKLNDKEILAEILFQLRQTEKLHKNMVVDLQNLNIAMGKSNKINKQTRDLTALD